MIIGYVLDDTLDRSDGVQQAVVMIGEKMRRLGHDVHYIVIDTKRHDLKNIHSIGKSFKIQFNGNSVRTPLPASKKKIKKLFEDISFDVLHVQMPYSPLMAGRIIKYAPPFTKIIGTFHILPYNLLSRTGSLLLGLSQRRQIKRFSQLCAVSKPAQNFCRQVYGGNPIVVPNPVNYTFFNNVSKKRHRRKKIVFVGRFEQRKGVLELIRAFAALPSRSYVDLILCGRGPLFSRAQKLAEELNIPVDFAGFVSEEQKARYLAQADIAVFPSKKGESFGIVLIEAMAAGAGVVLGGDNDGYRSVLEAWPKTLFNPKLISNFSETLNMFLHDEGLRERIGQQQHVQVKQYDIKEVASRLLKIY